MHIAGPPPKMKKSTIVQNRVNNRNRIMLEQCAVSQELLLGSEESLEKNEESFEHNAEDIIDDCSQEGGQLKDEHADNDQNDAENNDPEYNDEGNNDEENNDEGNVQDIPDMDEANEDDLEDY